METLEREQARLRKKALYLRKIKRATHLLFYRRHRRPGVKGWELRKRLGSDYPKVLGLLDAYLEKLDLQVKTVFEDLLRDKLPGWRVDINMDRYIRAGYLAQDENKQLYLDWRTRAEVDEKALVDLLLAVEGEKKEKTE